MPCYTVFLEVLRNLLRSEAYGKFYATQWQKLKVVLAATQLKTQVPAFGTAQEATTQDLKITLYLKTTFFLLLPKNFCSTVNAPIYQHKQS